MYICIYIYIYIIYSQTRVSSFPGLISVAQLTNIRILNIYNIIYTFIYLYKCYIYHIYAFAQFQRFFSTKVFFS